MIWLNGRHVQFSDDISLVCVNSSSTASESLNLARMYRERAIAKVKSQKSKVRSQKSKVKSQKSKVKSQKSKVRNQKSKATS